MTEARDRSRSPCSENSRDHSQEPIPSSAQEHEALAKLVTIEEALQEMKEEQQRIFELVQQQQVKGLLLQDQQQEILELLQQQRQQMQQQQQEQQRMMQQQQRIMEILLAETPTSTPTSTPTTETTTATTGIHEEATHQNSTANAENSTASPQSTNAPRAKPMPMKRVVWPKAIGGRPKILDTSACVVNFIDTYVMFYNIVCFINQSSKHNEVKSLLDDMHAGSYWEVLAIAAPCLEIMFGYPHVEMQMLARKNTWKPQLLLAKKKVPILRRSCLVTHMSRCKCLAERTHGTPIVACKEEGSCS
eukprot:6492802-Amphidinium_carterae.4